MPSKSACVSKTPRSQPTLLVARRQRPSSPSSKIRWREEDPILVPLDMIRPTQVAVGMRAVAAKREKVETRFRKPGKIFAFLEKKPLPAVRGPGDGLYIIDHHHLSLALWQSDVDEAFVRVLGDLSGLRKPLFWQHMAANGWMHPFDETGRRVRSHELPHAIHALRPDPYRDLAWSVREEGGFEKSRAPYSEFRWAQYFRERIALSSVKRNYDRALERALTLAHAPEARHLPGYIGR